MNDNDERDDAALVTSALGGDQRAFTLLMRRHKDSLYRFVRGYVGDADEAYDLSQEAFVSAWQALRRFDRSRPFGAWLKGIAINKCRDWARRRTVRNFFYNARDIQSPGLQIAAEAEPESLEQRFHELDAAIAKLPRALKEPLLLALTEDLTHREIGQALGISAKAVEVRIYRAKQALTGQLRSEGN